ncbi:hypothetical protein IO90_10410 [Chryseobacterium sp. FH1]|nr:hypothetical protein IO90_10410 [Chryseobacterium sp. FH1]
MVQITAMPAKQENGSNEDLVVENEKESDVSSDLISNDVVSNYDGQYVLIARNTDNLTQNILAIDANGNLKWSKAYNFQENGHHQQTIVSNYAGFYILASETNESNSVRYHTLSSFDTGGVVQQIVSLEDIIDASDLILVGSSLLVSGISGQAGFIAEFNTWDLSNINNYEFSGFGNIFRIKANDYGRIALKVARNDSTFGIAIISLYNNESVAEAVPTIPPVYRYISVGDDVSDFAITSDNVFIVKETHIHKTDLALNVLWVKEMVSDKGQIIVNGIHYSSYSGQLLVSSSAHGVIVDGSAGMIFYMNQDANVCLTVDRPLSNFPKSIFSINSSLSKIPSPLRSQSGPLRYRLSSHESTFESICDQTGTDEAALVQSSCIYLQAAGSKGTDSTAGIHLRWMLKGALAEHLPKGNYYQSPSGFNRRNDFVTLLRAPYVPVVIKLNLSVAPNAIVDSEALWLYEVGTKKFYVYFRSVTKYQQVRASVSPLNNPLGFLQQYGSNLVEVECKEQLFFAARLYISGISNTASIKTEIQSVETNQMNLPKHTSFRKQLSTTELGQKIFAENARSIRFATSELYINAIDFEFYSDFAKFANETSSWKNIGEHALTLEDSVAYQRLDPDPENHPIHAVWPRYNGGEFVNIDNYRTKWNGRLDDDRNRIKHSVEKYIEYSTDLLHPDPLANETYFLENEDGDIIDPDNGLQVSHLTILNMASLDYHVARMLGLGLLDFSAEVYTGQKFIYAAQYTTDADLNDGHGQRTVNHLALSLPTSKNDERSTRPVELLQPVPGIATSSTDTENTQVITDADGYTHDGTARYLSLFTREVTPDEPANSSFFFTNQRFDLSTFTYPVYVGIEYKKTGDIAWRSPELPNDRDYKNVNGQGIISSNETVAIALPDYGQPAFIHHETKSGMHTYGSYGVNWFSRATAAYTSWDIKTEIRATNSLLPPSNINSVLIQKESPLMFTSENEQNALATLLGDKTFIRLTFDYDASQDMITYLYKVNGVEVPDFGPLPDDEEVFADEVEIFFRPDIPKQLFGMITSVVDLPQNPLISVVQSGNFTLHSTGQPNVEDSSQTLSPAIPLSEIENYIGAVFTSGGNEFIIHDILPGNNDLPIFHILKQQVGNAFEQNSNTSYDPSDFIAPVVEQSFMIVENMQNESTWGNVNPHPLKVRVGFEWPIYTEEIQSTAGQAPDLTENTYYRKFRGIYKRATITKFVDEAIGEFQGVYIITFNGYTLGNHPQYRSITGQNSVQWYQGTVRVARDGQSGTELKTLKVLRIDNASLSSGDLKLYVVDETYNDDPIQSVNSRTTAVNYYPGYRVYLFKNDPCRLNEDHIYSSNENQPDKYSIFGLRSIDIQEDYKSAISTPTLMFARTIKEPQQPYAPLGANYATRPDYFGRSTYAFTTTFKQKPFSVNFLRSNDDILLSSLYKQTKYGDEIERNSVGDIRRRNKDGFENDRLLGLANFHIDRTTMLFKIVNGYRLPLPNNPQLFDNINNFITEHNLFYGESLLPVNPSNITNFGTVIIQGHSSNKHGSYGTLTFEDFIRQTIQNTYVPLTEIPVIYQHIKSGKYQPVNKAQVIRDRSGNLLSPSSPDFEMAPMAKSLNDDPHQVLFVDFNLDGNSNSLYFYAVKELNSQMEQSDLSEAVGPVKLVSSYPVKAPEIKSVTPVLENRILSITPKMQISINSYDKIYGVKKAKLYRALNMSDALSVRTMTLVQEIDLENEEMLDEESWNTIDSYIDLPEIPFGDPLYYRVTVETEIEYSEPDFSGSNPQVIVDYAPSEASKLLITTITESVLPNSPELSYSAFPLADQNVITGVKFTWKKQAYNAKYHLYKMNSQGNWVELATVQSNDDITVVYLDETTWQSDVLKTLDDDGNPLYHHFKVLTENTAGMMSVEENILTIGGEFSSLIETDVNLVRYRAYVRTSDLTRDNNLLMPPFLFFTGSGDRNNSHNESNIPSDLAVWKQMPDDYLVLPEINTDLKKNPHTYNLLTKKFGCYYTVSKMSYGSIEGSSHHFLKNSVKKARKAGARECIVDLGNNALFIQKNIDMLKAALLEGNDRGIDRISLMVDNVIRHYTIQQILDL